MNTTERRLITALCALAAVRVWLFSAAFPFFNNVDELDHVDMVVRYSRAIPLTREPHHTDEVLRLVKWCGCPEYTLKFGRVPSPYWALTPTQRIADSRSHILDEPRFVNIEASEPPAYYIAAAWWRKLGSTLGLAGCRLLYWLRFLNIPLYLMLMWLGYVIARDFYPSRPYLPLSVLIVLSCMPQDLYYSVNNCIPSALLGAASLYLSLRIWLLKDNRWFVWVGVGLIAGVAVATKLTNLPALVILAALCVSMLWRGIKGGATRSYALRVLAAAVAAAVPIAALVARNLAVFGDCSGNAEKLRVMTWTPASLFDVLEHPIFTPGGFSVFLRDLLASLWRGEFIWRDERLSYAWCDSVYAILSIMLLTLAVVHVVKAAQSSKQPERGADFLSLACVLFSVLVLMYVSVKYNYGMSTSPSVEHPYFSNGRLMTSALVPFIVLFLTGLHYILEKLKAAKLFFPIVGAYALLMLVTEIILTLPVFGSRYNWFHLP